MSVCTNVETVQRDFWVFQKFESKKFVRRKITTDFCLTRWQTLFWIWILFNHGRDSISISHHKVWSIAFWSLKFTGHLSILLDIFSTVFRQEDGAICTRTQNLFPSFTMRLASMEPGKKTNLSKTPFSSLNWSSTRSTPWRRSVKWLFISSRLITWPCSSQKRNSRSKSQDQGQQDQTSRVFHFTSLTEVKSLWPFQTCHVAFSGRCHKTQQNRRGTRQKLVPMPKPYLRQCRIWECSFI